MTGGIAGVNGCSVLAATTLVVAATLVPMVNLVEPVVVVARLMEALVQEAPTHASSAMSVLILGATHQMVFFRLLVPRVRC